MPKPPERIRVLHITARADTGGGPEVIRGIIAHSSGTSEHFICSPAEPPYHARFCALVGTGNMCRIPHRRLDLAALGRVVNFVRDHGVDVIHSHGFSAGVYGRLAGTIVRRPAVHTFHGFPGGVLRRGIERLLARWTECSVAVSESEAAAVADVARAVEVIPNGVHLACTAGALDGVARVLAVGRLAGQKDPLKLLDVAEACAGRIAVEFRVAGDGPLMPQMRRQVAERGLEGMVTLAGARESCAEEYSSAHIYLSTARWEGMSLALLEAMAAGLAPVVSRVMGNVDVIEDGVSGFLFDPDEPEAAADAIVRLARDEALRRAVGERARETALSRFSVEKMATSYETLYRRVATGVAA